MNIIRGKVTVKETGTGVPDLIISVYDLDPKTLPEEIFHIDPRKPVADLWQIISGDRLGSVVTDENGTFEMVYEDAAFQVRNRERRPDLTLFVVAPEDMSVNPGPCILHVSAARQNAGRMENYVIKLPLDILRKAEVSVPGIQTPALETVDYNNLLDRMKKLAEERRAGLESEKPVSEDDKEQPEAPDQANGAEIQPRRPPQSFTLARLLIRGLTEAMSIEQDEETGGLLLKEKSEAEPIPLAFGGVKYTQDFATEGLPKNESCLLVNPDKKALYLCMPRSPITLTAPDRPSELYKWHMRQRRPSAVAQSSVASPLDSPDSSSQGGFAQRITDATAEASKAAKGIIDRFRKEEDDG
jgi:hypothetical protein